MHLLKVLLGVVLLSILAQAQFCKPYCSATCSPGYSDCVTACLSPYTLNATSSLGCTLDSSLQVQFAEELSSSSSFTLSGYTSNTALSSLSCTSGLYTYHMMGLFVANNYLFKAFSGLGTNHFRVDIFWSYGIFGGWSGQQLSTIFTDGNGQVVMQANQGQNCALPLPAITPVTMTGCSITSSGCFRSYTQAITHSSDYLSVNFSSMGSATTSPQVWTVKDLVIVLSICNTACLTCSGSAATNCLTCPSGFYLLGSTCILTCPYKTMPNNRTCVTACPAYFYSNSYNGFCEPCPSGCPSCSNSTSCLDWGSLSTTNLILDYLPLWIVLGVAIMAVITLLIWKFCCSAKTFESRMEEEVIDHKPRESIRESRKEINQSNETMEARWLEDIDDLHLTKIEGRRVKGGIQGIGR